MERNDWVIAIYSQLAARCDSFGNRCELFKHTVDVKTKSHVRFLKICFQEKKRTKKKKKSSSILSLVPYTLNVKVFDMKRI